MTIQCPRKLIEVALPLNDINFACAREKSIRHGHPSTLHLWWARRPLAAARAVLFAQMVNDPGWKYENPTREQKISITKRRNALFQILRDLVVWENTNNEEVLKKARAAIRESWKETCDLNKGEPGFDPDRLPAFHDPFAGGGAIPLEAQRLGLESYASDLNPIPVMINKAMIEFPPKFTGRAPVGPIPPEEKQESMKQNWPGATGLAEDVRRYGAWMRDEAQKKIGHLYPQVEITPEMAADRSDLKEYVGQKLTVIAWLWARTVKSPHPDYSDVDVPLVSSFVLSSKKGHEAYVEPVIEGRNYRFRVHVGAPPHSGLEDGTKLGRGTKFNCIFSNSIIDSDYVRLESEAGHLKSRLMAIVCEGKKGRIYLSPIFSHEQIASSEEPSWIPNTDLPNNPRWFSPPAYGMTTYGSLFTPRQLVALNTFSDLVQDARLKAIEDAKAAGMADDGISLNDGGTGATAYGDALAVYLTFGVDKCSDYWSSICSWHSSGEKMRNTFGRQAIPMVWDYAECNPFCESSGNWMAMIDWTSEATATTPAKETGKSNQADAQTQTYSSNKIISTDPPYYDNIGYADLSDFFYVWMRRGLRNLFPNIFSSMATPKAEELVATPYRHGNREKAEKFFLDGMTKAMHNLSNQANPEFPVTIYYAFKQSDTDATGTSNAGWETFLDAVIRAGFAITGTWPMRTEMVNRQIASKTNALASSIVLVCRKRPADCPEITRRDFINELRAVMPLAIADMRGESEYASPVAPVDMAQAAIGPGMEIYSKYKSILKNDGSSMSVHEAIIEINKFLDNDAGNFDVGTNFCRKWFDTHTWQEGAFGEADTLARAVGTSVDHVKNAGVVRSEGGITQLIHWRDYPADYDPESDKNRPVWESCHHVVRTLMIDGARAAGRLLSKMREDATGIRDLAYVLYTLCERKGLNEDARAYNLLVTSWSDIDAAADEATVHKPEQLELL